MKVKTLRFKDSKEFVHILQDGSLATGSIPEVLPMTASMELFKKYNETTKTGKDFNYENLEVVEYDLIESTEIGSDIRNKLSPPKNLVAILNEYFDNPENPKRDELLKIIRKEMNQTKVSVEYLAKLF